MLRLAGTGLTVSVEPANTFPNVRMLGNEHVKKATGVGGFGVSEVECLHDM